MFDIMVSVDLRTTVKGWYCSKRRALEPGLLLHKVLDSVTYAINLNALCLFRKEHLVAASKAGSSMMQRYPYRVVPRVCTY